MGEGKVRILFFEPQYKGLEDHFLVFSSVCGVVGAGAQWQADWRWPERVFFRLVWQGMPLQFRTSNPEGQLSPLSNRVTSRHVFAIVVRTKDCVSAGMMIIGWRWLTAVSNKL
jgi:hypothetical protein